ncbi:MAG: DUF2147 domain-containing protein [Bacteroidales bacterium]
MKKTLATLFFIMSALLTFAQNNGDQLVNCKWYNLSGTNRIQFKKEANGTYTARVIWLSEPNDKDGKPRLDLKNPDKSRRSNKLQGTPIVWGLKYENGKWIDGTLYSPTKGITAKGSVSLNDKGELILKGTKFGISQTETFKKESL